MIKIHDIESSGRHKEVMEVFQRIAKRNKRHIPSHITLQKVYSQFQKGRNEKYLKRYTRDLGEKYALYCLWWVNENDVTKNREYDLNPDSHFMKINHFP